MEKRICFCSRRSLYSFVPVLYKVIRQTLFYYRQESINISYALIFGFTFSLTSRDSLFSLTMSYSMAVSFSWPVNVLFERGSLKNDERYFHPRFDRCSSGNHSCLVYLWPMLFYFVSYNQPGNMSRTIVPSIHNFAGYKK